MLSVRTAFDRILSDLSRRHREFLREHGDKYPHVPADCLAFNHPAFSIETKLDGERQLIHISRDGIVKTHSRSSNWYSDLYSPVIGPALRRAVKLGLDVILDGEILSWDDGRKETVPFGSNRTIANLRKKWMYQHGKLDPRDQDVHAGDEDAKKMSASNDWQKKGNDEESAQAGEECWLLFVAFDVLYVDGVNAKEFLAQAVSSHAGVAPGSLVDLDGFERKKILYRLLDPQQNEVEIVETLIVRPSGRRVQGDQYFHPSDPIMECGHPAYELDSVHCTIDKQIGNLAEIDADRRNGRSDEQISKARAVSIQALYDKVVEQQRQEGLIFKDLNAPYVLGAEASRAMKHWYKFKPDYYGGSVASDLDVLIIGAYFATGLRMSGEPSALLCACVDSEDRHSFFPVCKVNLGSLTAKEAGDLLKATGFRKNDDDEDDFRNKWFRGNKDTKTMPDFISHKSSPDDTEGRGWRVQKKDYPDLWINPDDSSVLTLNAGEIVVSDAFSAGVTLRFPRITKIRDDKRPNHIENELTLWERFEEVQQSRSSAEGHAALEMGSPEAQDLNRPCRFLTESELAASKKQNTKKTSTKPTQKVAVVSVSESDAKSSALQGITFAIVGTQGFALTEGSIDSVEAQEQGWLDMAKKVKSAKSVERMIKVHGGTFRISADDRCDFILGGSRHDPKVVSHMRAIKNASAALKSKAKSKSKDYQKQEKIAQSPGIVRWTFVSSLVHRYLESCADKQVAIKETH